MDGKELQNFYKKLPRKEKGYFLACLTLLVGGSPESWKNKLNGRTVLAITATMQSIIGNFVDSEEWKRYIRNTIN